jgi:hypothetical protein
MKYTILEKKDITNSNTIYEYDEEGKEIMGTESIYYTTTTITTVEYTLLDNTKIVVDIPHFESKSEEDIIKGISNRYITELKKLENK